MSDAIQMQHIVKRFGDKVAVGGLDLVLPSGALYGFIGPNGAGKTTTIRMIMSIIFPDEGHLSVLGKKSATESKDRIGYLPEERGVYKKMKVAGFLKHMAKLKGLHAGASLTQKVNDWLERVELGEVAAKKCEELSKGMQQKVQYIASVIHEPELLILDEPFSGLDPVNQRLMRELFREQHDRGTTMIFSTHVMQQAEQLCDHIVMLNKGEKVLDASLDEIRAQHDPRTIAVELPTGSADADRLQHISGVKHAASVDSQFELSLHDDSQPQDVIREVVAA
ncbi:MAG: ATP-binding cassette domain-containing protein, partial [Planctomycetota bacterium]